MKTSFWDRILMFLYVLITLAFGACMVLQLFGGDPIGTLFAGLERSAGWFLTMLIGLGLAAILALMSVYMLMMIFRRQKPESEAPFVGVSDGEGGDVRIALPALAQMARQAVGRVEGVREMRVDVSPEDDAVSVEVELTLDVGARVSSVTKDMKRTIRKSLETNCGVEVRDVRITVSSVVDKQAEPEKKSPRSGLLRRREGSATASASAATQDARIEPEALPPLEPQAEPEPQAVPEPQAAPEPQAVPEPQAEPELVQDAAELPDDLSEPLEDASEPSDDLFDIDDDAQETQRKY